MNKNWFIVLCLNLIAIVSLSGQGTSHKKVQALNNYVHFVNESTHGMLIVHRLLEKYNLEAHKYVEIESYELQNYSNKDLPKDIFLDEEQWFYENSPKVWQSRIINNKGIIDSDLEVQMNLIIDRIDGITSKVNKLRFQVEQTLQIKGLSVKVYLKKVYEDLQLGVKLFDQYHKKQLELELLVNKQLNRFDSIVINEKHGLYYQVFSELYKPLKSSCNNLRNEEDNKANINVKLFIKNVKTFNNSIKNGYFVNRRVDRKIKYLTEKLNTTTINMDEYLNKPVVSEEYLDYGKRYYYHNSKILNNTNKYGNGFITEANKIIELANIPRVMFFEIPHFFQVVKKTTWKKRDYKKDLKERKERRRKKRNY